MHANFRVRIFFLFPSLDRYFIYVFEKIFLASSSGEKRNLDLNLNQLEIESRESIENL
jgi:hypothetical protein